MARILLFSLDELRRRHGAAATPGAIAESVALPSMAM